MVVQMQVLKYFERLLKRSEADSIQGYQPYGGQRLAYFSPDELQSQAMTRGFAEAGTPQAYTDAQTRFGAQTPYNSGYTAGQTQSSYNPREIGQTYQAGQAGPTYQAGTITPQYTGRIKQVKEQLDLLIKQVITIKDTKLDLLIQDILLVIDKLVMILQ
jgi:hypothetical protein